jgi:glycosyltransferase involved in cell wall biosynthesis
VGGAERQAAALALGLDRAGHQAVVVTFYPGGALEADLAGSGVALRSLDKRSTWDWPRALPRLALLLRRERPRALMGFTGVPNILTVLARPLVPGMRAVFSIRASNMDLSRYSGLSRLCYGLERRLSPRADLIVANSHAGMAHAASLGYARERMRVVHNGIDTERFRPDPEARERVRRELAVPDGHRLVGLAGRIDPMKDHATFLRAAALLARERPDTRFACVGNGPARQLCDLVRLEVELGLAGRVAWTGDRDDMPAVYNSFDLLVSSSCYGEGFSNALGEAMACGTPCAATDVGDSALVLGPTGPIVPPSDPDALARAMAQALDRLDSKGDAPGLAARARIEAEFTVDRMVANTLAAGGGSHVRHSGHPGPGRRAGPGRASGAGRGHGRRAAPPGAGRGRRVVRARGGAGPPAAVHHRPVAVGGAAHALGGRPLGGHVQRRDI